MKRLADVMAPDEANELLPQRARCARCDAPVELEAFAAEIGVRLSKELLRRGEQPLGVDQLVYCDDCGDLWRREQEVISMQRLGEARRLLGEMRDMRGCGIDSAQLWLTMQPDWFRENHRHTVQHWLANVHVEPERRKGRGRGDV